MSNYHPNFFPRRISQYVPDMDYSSEVTKEAVCRAELGAPVALNTSGILAAQSIAVANTLGRASFATAYSDSVMGRYGRNVTVVASGAATSHVFIRGWDYLGQKIMQDLTLTGATPVSSVVAFGAIESVQFAVTAATTINVGWGDVLGLPYAAMALVASYIDDVAATAFTFVPRVATDPQTATTGDPRGTVLPGTATNGVRKFVAQIHCVIGDLHGVEHYYS